MPTYNGNVDTGAATNAVAVTPSDSTNLANGDCRAIYVGVSGDITLDTPNQTSVLFKAVPVGILPVVTRRVRATGTTATNLVALY